MKSGISCEQGEIVLVPFPFSDLSCTKNRPVLVLSKTEYNNLTEDIVTAGITSNLKDTNYSVIIGNDNLESGALPNVSMIKVDKLFTIDKSLIILKIGKLDKQTFECVKQELFKLI